MIPRLVASLLLLLSASADVSSGDFDERLAREKMLPLSAAAYSGNPGKCLSRKLPGASIVRQVDVKCDFLFDTCSGFIALSPEDQAIIISFRGTNNPAQLFAEAGQTLFEKHINFVAGGTLSNYFYKGYYDAWNAGLKDTFTMLAKVYPKYKLWVTGHSLGGAMAAIAAAEISATNLFPKEQILLMTFGQPRTGDKAFALQLDQLVPQTFRVTHHRDIVPHVPFEFLNFWHHSDEVFYPNGMGEHAKYKRCGKLEDNSCSDGFLDVSIPDHIFYYEKLIPVYGMMGCI